MAVIFCFSSQDAEDSSKMSGAIVKLILRLFYPKLESFSAERQAQLMEGFSFAVRKLAHFTEYAFLGTALMLHVDAIGRVSPLRCQKSLAFLVGALYALSDELHQSFVDGRAPAGRDVLIDSAGALAALLIVSVIINRRMADRKE